MSERAAKKGHFQKTIHSSTLINPREEERHDRENFENTLDIDQFSEFSDLESSSYLSEEEGENYTQIKRKIRTGQGQQVYQGNSPAAQISEKNLTPSGKNKLLSIMSRENQFAAEFLNTTVQKKAIDEILNEVVGACAAAGDTDESMNDNRELMTNNLIVDRMCVMARKSGFPNGNLVRENFYQIDDFTDKLLDKLRVKLNCTKLDKNFPICFPFHGCYIIVHPFMHA